MDATMTGPIRPRQKIGPCALHGCALEFALASLTIAAGLALILFPLGPSAQGWFVKIPLSVRPFIQPVFGSALLLSGLAQTGSVWRRWEWLPPHVAAMVSAIVLVFVSAFAFKAGLHLFFMTTAVATAWQVYVAGMIKP